MARVIKSFEEPRCGAAAVLKLADFTAEARALVLEARKEAARIAVEARTKAEQAQRDAVKRGYEEGFARGRNDGYADGQQSGCQEGLAISVSRASEALRCAGDIAKELAAAKAGVFEQARADMLEFALAVASRIVGRVAAEDLSVAKENLAEALEMASYSRQITVRVNPLQLAALKDHCREAVESLAIKGNVKLVADEQIGRGGVKVVTQKGQIDATVEMQLSRIVDALLREPAEDSPPPGRERRPDIDPPAGDGQFVPEDCGESSRVMSDESV